MNFAASTTNPALQPSSQKAPSLAARKDPIAITKMHATGNDFILINNIQEHLPEADFSELARSLCRRREAVGSDGLILLGPAVSPDVAFRMHFWNQDGSPGEMCGNGARCAARFAFEENLAPKSMTFDTPAGPLQARGITDRLWQIHLQSPSLYRAVSGLRWKGQSFAGYYLELGNPGVPHFCLELPGFDTWPHEELRDLAVFLRHHPSFPKGSNVNFFFVTKDDTLVEKTFERGVEDFTLSCGTGSACTALCALLQGKVQGPDVTVLVPGGALTIQAQLSCDILSSRIFLSGETTTVLKGLCFLEALYG